MTNADFLRRALIVTGLVIGAFFLLFLLWRALAVFLLLFAGVLLAVLLRAPTNWIRNHTPLSERTALIFTIVGLGCALAALVWLFAVPVSDQVGELMERLPGAVSRMREWARQFPVLKPLVAFASDAQKGRLDPAMIWRASGFVTSTVHAVIGAIVVLFIGFYLAAQPRLYQRGFIRLLPDGGRVRALDVLDGIGATLRRWLLARIIMMLTIGIAAGAGLWWLDVPLAFTLGLLTGLLEFIPYVGPLLSAVPVVLVAFNVEPVYVAYVGLLYLAIHAAEGYLLSPLIEQRTVSLPPALVVFMTILMGALAGGLGIALASPLTAAIVVTVRLLYVEDVMNKPKIAAAGRAL